MTLQNKLDKLDKLCFGLPRYRPKYRYEGLRARLQQQDHGDNRARHKYTHILADHPLAGSGSTAYNLFRVKQDLFSAKDAQHHQRAVSLREPCLCMTKRMMVQSRRLHIARTMPHGRRRRRLVQQTQWLYQEPKTAVEADAAQHSDSRPRGQQEIAFGKLHPSERHAGRYENRSSERGLQLRYSNGRANKPRRPHALHKMQH